MQPPATSAVYRQTHPDMYDRTKDTDRLEVVAVLVAQLARLTGNQTGQHIKDMPNRWEDLFPKERTVYDDATLEAEMAAMRAQLGWDDN